MIKKSSSRKPNRKHTVSNNSSKKFKPRWQFCKSTQPPSVINCCNNRRAWISCPCPIETFLQSVCEEIRRKYSEISLKRTLYKADSSIRWTVALERVDWFKLKRVSIYVDKMWDKFQVFTSFKWYFSFYPFILPTSFERGFQECIFRNNIYLVGIYF